MTASARAWPRRDANGRTNQPVRRDSREALDHEPRQLLSRRQKSERLAAFKRHATAARQAGRRRGHGWKARMKWRHQVEAYGASCADVLEYLMHQAVEHGRVFPTFKEIAEAVGCAYRTAVRCVQQLARGGWLEWERRFVHVAGVGGAGPQVLQTSNLYHLKLPNAAGALIDAWRARRAPPPDDVDPHAARIWASGEARAAEAAAVAEAQSAAERRNQHILARLAAARTPGAVLAIFQGHQDLQAALERLDPSPRPSANSLGDLKRS